MENFNVVILSDMSVWDGNTAGVIRLKYYSKALSTRDHVKIILFSPKNSLADDELVEVDSNIFVSSKQELIIKHKFLNNIRRNYFFIKSIHKWIKKQKNKTVCILYPSTNLSFELLIFFILRLFSKVDIYYELNEIRKYGIKTSGLRQLLSHYIKYIVFSLNQLTWRFYSGIICISKNIELIAKKYNNNTVVIPILSNPKGYIIEKNETKDNLHILFTGSINIKKENLLEFISALKKFDSIFSNWLFDLCGSIDKRDETILRNYIKKHNINEKVRFLGNMSHAETLKLQCNASLLVLPRKNNLQNYYGFSTKLSEYAVSGTPIMMTNTGVVSDYFKDNYNCYMVDGYACDDFYNKLLYFINQSEDQNRKISENAYQTAVKYFNYINYSDTLRKFLQLDN